MQDLCNKMRIAPTCWRRMIVTSARAGAISLPGTRRRIAAAGAATIRRRVPGSEIAPALADVTIIRRQHVGAMRILLQRSCIASGQDRCRGLYQAPVVGLDGLQQPRLIARRGNVAGLAS